MNLSLYRILTGLILAACTISFSAQEKQYNFNQDKSQLSLIVEKENTKMLVVNTVNTKGRGLPLREAKLYTLGIEADTVGVWSVLPTKENVWKLSFNIPDAKGFFIGFDQFYLPEGSCLYVYEKSNLKSAIVYKHDDNPKGGPYSIENLKGDNVVLEYVAPEGVEKPKLHISDLGYKYLDEQGNPISGFNSAANSCMINVNCPENNFWKNQKKGVVHFRVKRNPGANAYLCSGTLVNNTSEDKTPYILTAYHCFEYMSETAISGSEFFFEYETPECEMDTVRPNYKYHKGAIPLVLNPVDDGSDGALIKLSEPIPDDWDVYYNGWDRTNDGASVTGGAVIHHPLGDVKKISLYNKPLTSGKWEDEAPNGTHWIIDYLKGATEGGSSGAPLFNQDGYIVGTLTGGDNKCSNPTGTDYYGKFWYHWDQYPDEDLHMSKYLDPNNTGVTRLKGLNAVKTEEPEPGTQPELVAYIESDVLHVYAKDILKKVRVADLFGRIIYSATSDINSSVLDIPVSSWRGGVYILSVDITGRSTKSVKVLK
ncbi:serine protease [Dysgonomonas sp. 521]|uniref:trypsin-like serine peptidase n=1 Tax=Dysgonomonas sp. 521 TaxID=2302932 RepID=UPI0013D3E464|nr:trypsin-like peptidase domain-containing protein [Dysgonomonas sp. 521]NDV94319.1 serine protease [Dysgonomonas sp. 521]